MSQDKILIIDNEMEIIQLMRLYLSREGYEIVWTTDSSKATELAKKESPDLVLLDVVMPGISGIEVCHSIREFSQVPILFVSCKDQEIDKVLGLSIGGDDYITKPFSPTELVARVKANLRRNSIVHVQNSQKDKKMTTEGGNLKINLLEHNVFVEEKELFLTTTEFDILVTLAKEPNRVFTAHQLFSKIFKVEEYEEDFRTIRVHISNLRRKLSEDPNEYIKTVRGVGYKILL